MAGVTAESLRAAAENTLFLRKAMVVLGYLAPMSAAAVTTLTDATDSLFSAIPAAYIPVGLVSRANPYSFPTEVSTEDVESLNHASPTRTDITAATRQINYTAQETKKVNLEVAFGVDLSAVQMTNYGEVKFPHPELPLAIERRLLVVGWDPSGGGWAMGRFYPRVRANTYPEIRWGGDSAIEYETTLQAYVDDTLGYSVLDIPIAGPGADALQVAAQTAIGFTKAT